MDDFGKKIDDKVKSGTVSNWETGKNLPNNKRLVTIAKLGGISVDELLYGKTLTDLLGEPIPDTLSQFDYKVIGTASTKQLAKNGLRIHYTLLKLSRGDVVIYTGLRFTQVIDSKNKDNNPDSITYLCEDLQTIDEFHNAFENDAFYNEELQQQKINKLKDEHFVSSGFYIKNRKSYYEQNEEYGKTPKEFMKELITDCIRSFGLENNISINEITYYESMNKKETIIID